MRALVRAPWEMAMADFVDFWTDKAVRRAVPALPISVIGVVAVIGAIVTDGSAALSYTIPAAVVILNAYLFYVIYSIKTDSVREVVIGGTFFFALFLRVGGIA